MKPLALHASPRIRGRVDPLRSTTCGTDWRPIVALSLALLICVVEPLSAAAAGTWSATGNLNIARYLHIATLLPSGKVLVAGGSGISGVLTSAEIYDPALGTWTATGRMITARNG